MSGPALQACEARGPSPDAPPLQARGHRIIVSSEAEELARLCSKVHVMRDGGIVQTLVGHDVTQAKISHATVEGRLEMSNA
jgi:ABC-type uncharacterized transport system ATPase subunit